MADPQALAGRRRRRARARTRRAARGAAQPQPGRDPPGDRAEEQPRRAGDLERPRPTCRRCGRRGAGAPARRALPGRARASATASATSTLMIIPTVGSTSSTCPTEQADKRYYEPSEHGAEAEVAARMRAARPDRRTRSVTRTRTTNVTAGELAIVVAAVLCCLGFAALDRRAGARARHAADAARRGRRRCAPRPGRCSPSCAPRTAEARATMHEARDDLDRFDRVLGLGGGDQRRGRRRRPGRPGGAAARR